MRTIFTAAVLTAVLGGTAWAGEAGVIKTMDQQRLGWERAPTAVHLNRFFPAAAKSARLKDATVQVACTPDKFGALECETLSENPPGMGFGEAAVKTLEKAKVRAGVNETPEGRTFRYTVHFGAGLRQNTALVADASR